MSTNPVPWLWPFLWLGVVLFLVWPAEAFADDRSLPEIDQEDEEVVDMLPTVQVHGFRIHPGQERGPVPIKTPWPVIPPSLLGEELDERMIVRFFVDPRGVATLVVLEPASRRELTVAALSALRQWEFLPQIHGDTPVAGRITVRLRFRTR